MSISDRILRRILARIERQVPIPQVDGLHGQHAVSLPAGDWPYLIEAVTKLDDWRCAQTPRLVEVTAALRGLWLVTACGTDEERLTALTVAGDLLASMDGFGFEAAPSTGDAAMPLPAPPREAVGVGIEGASRTESTDAPAYGAAEDAQRKSEGGGT